MPDNTISPSTGVGGFTFGETTLGGDKDAWVTGLPPELKAAFEDLESAPPEMKAQLAEALVRDGLKAFDEAAKAAGLTPEQKALWRQAVEDSLRGSAGTIFMNRLSAEKMGNLSIEELMFFVMSERTKQLDRQIRGFAEEIQNRNNLMEYANNMLAQARNFYAGLDDDESAEMPAEMVAFFESNGIAMPNEEGYTDAVATNVDPATKISDADAALTSMDGVAYADNACIKRDVPDDVMTFCAKYGIEVPNDGKSLQKKDLDTLKGRIREFKAEATAEQSVQAANPGGEAPATAQTLSRDEWDAAVQNVKGFLEGLNNQSELDMIKYQSVMSKFTSAIEMLSNTMKKLSDNRQAVVRNMT